MKINKRLETITILGVELDKENFPILYSWAKRNPETLAKQLKSIADIWHEGNLNMAAISLESDLKY